MVYRIYVEKKPGFDGEAQGLLHELVDLVGIQNLTGLRLLNRYDVEGIDAVLFQQAVPTVFSEPPVDVTYDKLPDAKTVFAVEYLPGQFDQRADSASECIQLLSQGERPAVRSARVYLLDGDLTDADLAAIKKYVINPVEAREASLDERSTLKMEFAIPTEVETLTGFTALDDDALEAFRNEKGLAMDHADIVFCQNYFKSEHRDPTITEIRLIDTYWSDHCRHTTFSTHLDEIRIDDDAVKGAYARYLAAREEVYGAERAAKRPQTLMDIATIGTKTLKARGLLPELDESEEINACSTHVPAMVNGKEQDWLLMFKNETHNHPTEIEPFGGAATCIGGCIRDPLSGRAYVHQAMRVTGGGDPRKTLAETLPGKLPQRKLAQTAAAGYSSYGNQIGLATGHVAELYHEGYIAKRLECGAVVAAAPAKNVVRERPAPGDVVILLGGRTGRDGIGGATGSSKSHDLKSLTTMASEVQKGNAPEERKIQRLFRNGEVTRLIKRCNDFGAGGVSVAIGELADGLEIELDAVRKKYEGLDGTELAISESQERMAVVVAPEDEAKFIAAAQAENLEAYRVAVVTESPRMVMHWRGQTVADLSRAFLDTNGAVKHASIRVEVGKKQAESACAPCTLRDMAGSLKSASRRGLTERFDSTVGAFSLLMPFGGKTQRSPSQAMAALLPVLPGSKTEQGSVMAWGCDPDALSADPYTGAHSAVYTSVAKIVAAGADYHKAYLTLQEFFEKLRNEPVRWGKPFAALLGALDAQLELGAAAIGGKDSMSGTFLDHDVPPTLISFAIAPVCAGELVTTDFKSAGHGVYLFYGGTAEQKTAAWERFTALARAGKAASAWAVENGLAEAVMKMSLGNEVGFAAASTALDWYRPMPGAIVAELTEEIPDAVCIGITTAEKTITIGNDVWFGGSADTCRTLATDGKLLTYTPVHAADLTNAAYGDADGYWYGVSVDAVVFAVNSDVLRRMTISAPKDWADLTDPVYQELIWLPTYRSTEIGRLTAYSAALRLGRDKGLDYLAALDTSVQFYTAADDTFVKCLSTGECVIAVGWLHDGLSALSADTSGDLHLIIPASGTFGQVTASAILSGASHTAAAQLWQEFVLSPACADLAEAHGDYRLPTIGSADLVQRTGVTLDPSLLSPTGDADTIEDKETLVSDLIETLTDTGIDTEDTARWNVA